MYIYIYVWEFFFHHFVFLFFKSSSRTTTGIRSSVKIYFQGLHGRLGNRGRWLDTHDDWKSKKKYEMVKGRRGEGSPLAYKMTMMEKPEIYIYIIFFFHSFTLDKRTFFEWQFHKNDDSRINIIYIKRTRRQWTDKKYKINLGAEKNKIKMWIW